MIKIKRIYDEPDKDDGLRVLVERLWPRGISKEKGHIDLWIKDAAPSTELRKWFNHEDDKWEEFVEKYWIELNEDGQIKQVKELAEKNSPITFIYSAKNTEHNSAVALKNIIMNIK
ncbi:DUF488 family protein [Ferroplasma sp.]|uniref:DUF488 domain-containing protein n=1 Tax=Ferroplasma sp. TaxID=2591003 RepID=UPI00307E2DC1